VSSSHSAAGASRLATPRILAFASSGIPQAALLLAAGTYLVPLYTVHVGITLVAYTVATAMVRIVDLLFDPFLGWMMDRTHTSFGRFRPWFLAGVPVTMAGGYMLLNPPEGAGVPYHERSRVYGWMTVLGPIGSVGLLCLPFVTNHQLVLGSPTSYHPVSLMILVALPLSTFLMMGLTPERPAPERGRQRFGFMDYVEVIRHPTMVRLILADLFLTLGPGVTGPLYNFFFGQIKGFRQEQINYLLIFFIGAALLGGLVWPRVARRFGKHRTLQITTVLYAVAQCSLMAIPRGWFIESAVGMFCVGFCVSAHILLIRAMVADYSDEVRLTQGKERSGILYAMVTTTQKLGASINLILVFPLLQWVFHFEPRAAVNTEFARFGLQLCYLFTPIIFVLAAGAMFFGYKLDEKRHKEIRDALDERDRAENVELTVAAPAPAVSR
jgi:GPH family glycoside/pentoside/hexuronide:cation symporter